MTTVVTNEKHADALRKRYAELNTKMEALIKDKPALTADEGRQFDEMLAERDAIATLAAPRRAQSQDIYATNTEVPEGEARSAGRKTGARARLCSELFGVTNPSNGGFRSLEDMARAITLGSSSALMIAGQSSGIPSDGGYAIPQQHMFEMLDKSLESEIVRPRCRVVPMESDNLTIATFDDSTHASGQLFGGLYGTWAAEGDEIAYRTADLRQIKLDAKMLAMLTAATNRLLTASPQFEGEFTKRMTETLGWNLDRACLISGTGAGQPRSVLNDGAIITVAKESGQPAATIVYENLTKMFSRLHPGCLANSTWVAHVSTIPQLLQLTIPVGTGGSHVPVMSESNGQFKILTRPVVFTEKLNTLGSLGDIMLVDFSQYVMGIMKDGMRLDRSQHVKFTTDETVWRTIIRVDGFGTWKQAFQPVNGSTLSWAVTLAARA